MKVLVSDLRNPHFGRALKRLDEATNWKDLNAVKRYAATSEAVGEAFVSTSRMLDQNTSTFAKKDKDGKPMRDTKTGAYVISDESQSDYNDMLNAFFNQKIVLDCEPIREKDLVHVGISPSDWSAIKWLVK